jgi:hypothetical protein
MRSFLKFLPVIGVIAVVIAIGVGLGWFGVGGRQPKGPTPTPPNPSPGSSLPDPNRHGQPVSPTVKSPTNSTPAALSTNRPATSTNTVATTTTITDWEEKLETILAAEGDDRDKVRQLLAMFSRLPQDGQVEVAQHLSNLVPDEDYDQQLKRLMVDAKLPEDVLDVLIADILNRPNSVKLLTLLEVARNPQHSKAEEARDLLELYLEENYGQDWNKWQAKTQQWLEKNPD